ncbi:hypothetical protein A1sIA56_00170 [Candidatus Planktophila sulfonica]|uniref:Capsule polysaccharide biosynthesis protein n=1 Tax=Candidatus Planktophila sulfonica TaxID=1884904 RepID=A0A249KF93_9ACTN|nr:hypothetical protein [Candidatus Planktophila sulfonica]ASY15365.1 hypothetical protein A1sIA56_00170 [Candidatus Planktophila sulfonica]
MSAFGLTFDSSSEEKAKVCDRCIRTSKYINEIPFFENVSMPDLSAYDQEIFLAISEVNSTNWHQFEFAGMPIGKMAAYEFLLNNKIASLEIPEKLFPAYLSSLRYSMGILFFSQVYLAEHAFDTVIVYNRIYSVNNVFCRVAESLGIPTYTLHAAGSSDNHYSKFSLYRDDLQALTINNSAEWAVTKQIALNKQESKLVVNHFRGLLSATSPWVYSSKFKGSPSLELRERMKIPINNKVLLLTTSSADEIFAIKLIGIDPIRTNLPVIFKSQLDWIESVCKYVSSRDDLSVIVRIHPREFPNKRESIESSNGKKILDLLEKISGPNIYVNLPGDNISLYDLAKTTNLLLTGNSSAGAELAVLEIPILCHERRNLTAFPEDLAFWATTKQEYFELIPKLLILEKAPKQAILATRWISFKSSRVARPTRLSKESFLLLVESSLRRPAVKYDAKVPKSWIRFIYRILFWSLNFKDNSEFNLVVERNLPGLHVLAETPTIDSKLLSESDVIQKIKKLLKYSN